QGVTGDGEMMRTLVTMLAGLLLLYLAPTVLCQGCAVNKDERPLVRDLQKKMIYSVNASAPPNPSILLALRLAQDHNKHIEQDMLNKLSQDAVQRAAASFSSGQVALHILAQRASCADPRRVSANGSTVNLVRLLEQKFKAELQNIAIHGNPLTNFYQLSLDVLALCQLNGRLSPANASTLLSPTTRSITSVASSPWTLQRWRSLLRSACRPGGGPSPQRCIRRSDRTCSG
ncbi:transcobalamin 1, partial [Chelydra serpentina]